MKLLWLCNTAPGVVKETITGKAGAGGLWVDHVLKDLRNAGVNIHILCPGDGASGKLDESCGFSTFPAGAPYEYRTEQETLFRETLRTFAPNVIHIWGTEYAHTLAMVNAVEQENLLDHCVVSIQGLCSVYTRHYAEGVPDSVQRSFTLRDFLRRDNIRRQQKKFALRGELEVQALKKVRHVIGRTDWDYACTKQINPDSEYHFCNETLREPFYEGRWRYDECRKHRVFASSCAYPVKGFHYLLEAFGMIAEKYPDAVLAVPGRSFLCGNSREKLRQSGYEAYLARMAKAYHLENRIEFLGRLSAEQMKAEYLKANVFALPSTIENSPNSLGEAMILGLPCVSAHVGGVANLMQETVEGFIYQPSASYMLAHYLEEIFTKGAEAEKLGQAAAAHAATTHDPEENFKNLMQIYQDLA